MAMLSDKTSIDKKIFLRINLTILLSVVTTLLIVSGILYPSFQNNVLDQLHRADSEKLHQTRRGVASMMEIAMTVSNQIYNDPSVSRVMYFSDPQPESLRIADEQLTNYRLTLPFIDSVYVFNSRNGMLYANISNRPGVHQASIQPGREAEDLFIRDFLTSFRDFAPYTPIPRRYRGDSSEAGKSVDRNDLYYTYVVYDQFSKDQLSSAVIVNVSERWIGDYIRSENAHPESRTFIMDDRGTVVSQGGHYPMLSDLSSEDWTASILNNRGPGIGEWDLDETRYLITYTESDDYGWRYVRMIPSKSILAPIRRMRIITGLAALGMLVLGVPLVILLSRGFFTPIDEMMSDLNRLLTEKKKNTRPLRNVLIRDILLQRNPYHVDEVQQKFDELGLAFRAEGWFRIILLKIDDYEEFCTEYSAEERSLFKKALVESVGQVIGDYCQILEIGEEAVVVLLNAIDIETAVGNNSISRMIGILQARVLKKMELSISCTVSSLERGAEALAELYHRTLESSRYRLFHGRGAILFEDDLEPADENAYEYPKAMEKHLVQSIREGKLEMASSLFDNILERLTDCSVDLFVITLSRLSFAVNDAVRLICRSNNLGPDLESGISMARLAKAETVDDIREQYHDLFAILHAGLQDKKDNRQNNLVDEINAFIDDEYNSRDLYIESIAEHLKRSGTYISHVYKHHTGSTILDRIMEVRMDKARQLLSESRLSVAQIAEQTGFSSSSYFFKVFKRHHGSTPNAYRIQSQNTQREERIDV